MQNMKLFSQCLVTNLKKLIRDTNDKYDSKYMLIYDLFANIMNIS